MDNWEEEFPRQNLHKTYPVEGAYLAGSEEHKEAIVLAEMGKDVAQKTKSGKQTGVKPRREMFSTLTTTQPINVILKCKIREKYQNMKV